MHNYNHVLKGHPVRHVQENRQLCCVLLYGMLGACTWGNGTHKKTALNPELRS